MRYVQPRNLNRFRNFCDPAAASTQHPIAASGHIDRSSMRTYLLALAGLGAASAFAPNGIVHSHAHTRTLVCWHSIGICCIDLH